MANAKHLRILKRGSRNWNDWRARHPEAQPDFSWTKLNGANLRTADLRGALLSETDLGMANLYKADLRGADISSAELIGADSQLGGPKRSEPHWRAA